MDDMKKAIEFLEEMGQYSTIGIDNIKKELENLEKMGYDVYYDANKDMIIMYGK